ncbi:nipped-B-like protein [Ornithodoros turicata]|uniref:Nipped-B protein n=1 Tax=Ornithodoros turicata TaxID=34597 RepID=A0A2R5LL71_9ACAR
MMNGEGGPNVPITTLAGIQSITELLLELPLPTALSGTQRSLLAPQQIEEARRILTAPLDTRLLPPLIEALGHTPGVEQLELEDDVAGTPPPQACSQLLQHLLARGIFKGPSPWQNAQAALPNLGTEGVQFDGNFYPNVPQPPTPHFTAPLGDAGFLDGGQFSPKFQQQQAPGVSPMTPASFYSNGNCVSRDKRTESAVLSGQAVLSPPTAVQCEAPAGVSGQNAVTPKTPMEALQTTPPPAPPAKEPRRNQVVNNIDVESKRPQRAVASSHVPEPTRKSPQKATSKTDPKRTARNSARENNRIVSSSEDEEIQPVKKKKKPRDGERCGKVDQKKNCNRTPPKSERSSMDIYASSLSERVKNRRRTSQKAKYAESRSASDGEHSAFEPEEEVEQPPRERVPKPVKPKKVKKEPAPAPLSSEEMMESNTYQRFTRTVEAIFDAMEEVDLTQELDDEVDCPSEALVSAGLLRDLCNEAAKLKVLQGTSQVPQERINKLMAILERNIIDGSRLCPIENPHEDPDDDEGRLWLDLVMERINRSTDASLTVLYITTSPNMTTKLFLEDILERVVTFAKFQIQNTVYPVFDPVYRTDSRGKDGCVTSIKQKRAHATHRVREKWVLSLYNKLHELVGLMAEVLENQRLTDTLVLQISALGVGPFFVEGVSELQLHALRLVTTIFAQYEKHRQLILEDILASIARLPTSKRSLRNYRLNSEEHIQMLTALVLQLIHSVVKLPDPRPPDPGGGGSNDRIEEANKEKEDKCAVDSDVLIVTSYEAAVRTAINFLSVFLKKCGTKNEDMDYRPVFENFVQDLLSTVNKPEWPAGELVLSLLGCLLVQNFSNKSLDMSLRVSSLDYLGVVAARLRKDAVTSQIKKETIDDILRQIEEDEEDDMPLTSLSRGKKHSKRPNTSTSRDEIQLLQRALLHYLDANLESAPSLQFTRKFYIAQWYRDALAEAKADRNNKDNKDSKDEEQSKTRTNNRQVRNKRKNCEKVVEEESEEEDQDDMEEREKKESKDEAMQKALALAEERKRFLLQAAHPETCGRGLRVETLDQATAELISRFLASRRPFSQSFDVYLSQILRVLGESAVAVRTKAMKCLTLVVEADPSILGRPDMCHGVHGRLLDHSTSVREAAVDLVGKFILVRPELTHKYYDMLTERILDTGVSVRKRVIKILKDVCLEQPDFEKIPEICVKVIRRVNDEDGIRKLVGEVFQSMWFTPQPNEERMLQKVRHITHVVAACREMGLEWLEQLLNNLLKNKEDNHYKAVLQSCRQIVDCLVEHVLELEEGIAAGGASQHLVACLTTLYLFSKIRPQLLVRHAATIQPYLSMRLVGPSDFLVLQNATRCLELVVPLMEHPSEAFLAQVEESLAKQLLRHGLALLPTTVSCLGAVVNRVTKNYQLVRDFFHKFLLLLGFLKQNHETGQPCEKPKLQRCLYTLGLLCRHFELEHLEAEDGNSTGAVNDGRPLRDRVFEAVIHFTRHEDEDVRIKALTGLGFLLVRHHDLMLGPEVKELYRYLLGNLGCPAVERCQVLKNLTAYLFEEEARMIQKDAEWSRVSKEENLKEMGDVSSGMASTVVQVYLRDILTSVTSSELIVRRAALHVIQLIMGQGLVHPVQMVPHLVCLESDDDQPLRTKADQLLQDLEKKYPGFVQMKAIAGVRMAFQVHRDIQRNSGAVRGYREPPQGSNDAPASRHGFLYTVLRATRQSRRAFLLALLKLFDEHTRTPLSELLYVADNIVYFPYQVQDEPLFVMHHIDVLLSVSGSNLLQSFREALLPRNNGTQPEEDDDDDDDVGSLCARLPEDRSVLRDSMVAAQACMLLLFVKQTLKDTYGFTDGRIQQYSPNESAKTYEKTLNRKSGVRFKPAPALEALQADENSVPDGEELVQRYLDFKQLMLTIDPDEDGDDDNPRPPPPPGFPLPQSSAAEGGEDATRTPKQRLPPTTPSGSSRPRVGRPPKSARALVPPVKKKPRKKRKRVVCSDESSDNEDSDPSFGGD